MPLIGIIRLKDGEVFDKKHPEAYVYEVIGGNHSRIALNQILEEKQNDIYRIRTVSVYDSTISDTEAQHLSLRHNRATEFTNKMLNQDKVSGK